MSTFEDTAGNSIRIELAPDAAAFAPGERIACTVRWELDEAPESIEANLVWHTRGIGTEDVGVGDTAPVVAPAARGSERLELTAPAFPYSFSGKLVSLAWEVEVHVDPDGPTASRPIVISPDRREITLG